MALRTPPSWLQNGSHPAENDRLSMQSIIATTGTIGTSSLLVAQAATPGMAIQIAAGWGAIVGNFTTNMGVYQFYNDAATQVSVTTADTTNPRIDRVVVTVNDSYYSGATNNVTFTIVAGTAAPSPAAPATPTNSISLATIAVAANATSIVNANITDTRVSITTNLPVGDLTEITSGTGITVTSGTGPIPTVAINTAVTADLTTAQTLTNKKLSDSTTTIVDVTDATKAIKFDVAGTTAITGTIATAFTTAKTLSLPDATDTLVGLATTDTLTNKTLTSPITNTATHNNSLMKSPEERCTVSATAATGTVAFDTQTQGILYYTTNASANFTLNFTNVNANLATGDSISCVFLNTNGSTAYYPSAFQVDSVSVTPKWSGGTAPAAGNASAIDAYSFTIIKTAATPTYTVLAGGATKFA